MRAHALASLLAIAGALSGCSGPPRWHVAEGHLRAPDGRAAILRGANVSGAQKNAPYLDVFGPDDYRRLADTWGMNGIRFVMTWAAVEPERGRYDDAYLDKVAERLAWAEQAGLAVVLDMHQDIFGEGFGFDGAPRWTCDEARYAAFEPTNPWFLAAFERNVVACVDRFWEPELQGRFVAAWAHVAKRLAASKAVIGFDPLNEPLFGSYDIFSFEKDRLSPFYARVVEAVRASAPDWVAFLEPASTRNAGLETGLVKPDFRDVVYAPHSYDIDAEAAGAFDPAHRDAVLKVGRALAAEARKLGAALWIGEYGGQPEARGYAEYMAAGYDAQGAAAAGAMYWDFGRGGAYALLDAAGAPRPAALAAIARPYPSRVAGDPLSYAYDLASGTFRFRYRARGALTTELRVPPPAYPGGYDVACGGCAAEVGPAGVTLRGVREGAEVEVVLTRR